MLVAGLGQERRQVFHQRRSDSMVDGAQDNAIRAARIAAGLNIKQLAELLGAPYRTVQEWNAGRHLPPDWMAKLIVAEIERRKTE